MCCQFSNSGQNLVMKATQIERIVNPLSEDPAEVSINLPCSRNFYDFIGQWFCCKRTLLADRIPKHGRPDNMTGRSMVIK